MTDCRRFNTLFFLLTGSLLLLAGMMVYVCDRPPTVIFMKYLPLNSEYYGQHQGLFGYIGGFLPAFCHAGAFSLLSAGIARSVKPNYSGIVLFWTSLNIVFELGQKFQPLAEQLISALPVGSTLTSILMSGPLNGTYDIHDIFAAIAGGATAWIIIYTVNTFFSGETDNES